MVMNILRTPDECFQNLADYDFEPSYTTINDDDGTPIRIHSIDIGPKDAKPILLMHGNPTWSYIYRHVINALKDSGRRIIAVDLVGCGRSDKPAKRNYYTLARHHQWLSKWLIANDLNDITLVCQDWGGTLGLKLVADFPERFEKVFATNTGLPIGKGNKWLIWWLRIMRFMPSFPWTLGLKRAMVSKGLSKAEFAAIKAPFPSIKYQAGILAFPQLIAISPDNPGTAANKAAWAKLADFDKPFVTVFGTHDPVTRGMSQVLQKHIPGCRGQAHSKLIGVGHFSPEEAPHELAVQIKKFLTV
ncbi:haloalkane dehalogenase [Paraferrimonas sp. SM1919]|uniref:haloalkane dehalogenase n=1 Tax=Paraferrimonas sp. SM1919 TaxID=2662263 RepID=UPI001969A850|nr:haloalkane dehalogenase [Paraferrimonas sp. SM1919]